LRQVWLGKALPRLPFLSLGGALLSAGLADIQLDVRGGDIIVDLPGTSYTVTLQARRLPPASRYTYPRSELTQAQFLARAWRVANDKAGELGWIS
jgi:hypothetical protein